MKRGHPYIDVFGKGSITMEKAVQTSQRTDQELSSVQFLTITAAFVALTYIFTARFFIEFTKEIQEAFEASLPLDMGQLLSIPFVILGVVCMLRYKKR